MRVLKWVVPVDDNYHPIGWGKVVHVACQHGEEHVMVWTEESEDIGLLNQSRAARVFGTGHPIPPGLEHLGSVVTGEGRLVWHLYAAPPDL